MNRIYKIQTILEIFLKGNMHLSVEQKTGLVTVCYLVFPGAPYTVHAGGRSYMFVSTVGDEVQDCKD